MMYAPFLLRHAPAHIEAVEEDPRHPQGNLREVEHDAGLVDEVHTLGSAQPLLGRSNTIQYSRRAIHFLWGEGPLADGR